MICPWPPGLEPLLRRSIAPVKQDEGEASEDMDEQRLSTRSAEKPRNALGLCASLHAPLVPLCCWASVSYVASTPSLHAPLARAGVGDSPRERCSVRVPAWALRRRRQPRELRVRPSRGHAAHGPLHAAGDQAVAAGWPPAIRPRRGRC
jgi:hypothetical protein